MNKKDFSDQIRARREEIMELEELVQKYSNKLKVSPLLKGNMVVSFRMGVIETLDYLDQKAQDLAIQRSVKQEFVGE